MCYIIGRLLYMQLIRFYNIQARFEAEVHGISGCSPYGNGLSGQVVNLHFATVCQSCYQHVAACGRNGRGIVASAFYIATASTSVVVVLNVFEPLNFGKASVVISQYTGESCFVRR